jgi:AAA domain, putative AbiEii toxin, Type IV TA system
MEFISENNDTVDIDEIINACEHIGVPYKRIFEGLNHDFNATIGNIRMDIVSKIKETLNSQILYLPTYRRIEEDLSRILRGREKWLPESFSYNNRRILGKRIDYLENSDYIELVEFGMKDVKQKIIDKQEDLNRFSEISFKNLTYMNLGDVVDRKYQVNIQYNITDDDIKKFILCSSRISEKVLSAQQIDNIIDTVLSINPDSYDDPHSQIVLYYFRKLLDLQRELEEREQSIREFCEVCNKYLVNKTVDYDDSTFTVTIVNSSNPDDPIDMSYLSSGEKQIVSLFSHLYLSKQKRFFVLIDEPELSLSVPWQKTFLEDIRNSNLCSGLIAVTHSPFIYDNSLMKFAHGLGEFIIEV